MGEPAPGEFFYVGPRLQAEQPGAQVPEPGEDAGRVLVLHGEQRFSARTQRLAALRVRLRPGGRYLKAFHNYVAAVAVQAERAYAGPARAFSPVAQPVLRLQGDMKSFFCPGKFFEGGDFQHRGQYFLIEREGGFNDSCQAAGGARVADHRLDRAQRALELRGVDPVKIGERFRFCRVFGGGSAAVGFKVADSGGVDLRFAVGFPEGGSIGLRRGRGFIHPASGREAEPFYDGVNPVPVADRVVEPLEDDGGRAFAGHSSVGAGVERPRLGGVRFEFVRS